MLTQRREDVLALLDAQRHRRFIKTHTPLDGLPADERVTYVRVGRDPRDVAVSWYHHFQNLDEDTFMRARAQAVGLDDVEALAALDPSSGARRLRSSSGTGSTARPRRCIPPPRCARRCTTTRKPYAPPIAPTSWCATTAICRRIWRARCAVWRTVWGSRSRSGYGRRWWRRRRSSGCGPAPTIPAPDVSQRYWRQTQQFFHGGTAGSWRAFCAEAALRRYEARVAELAPPPVAHWAHHGWRGARTAP